MHPFSVGRGLSSVCLAATLSLLSIACSGGDGPTDPNGGDPNGGDPTDPNGGTPAIAIALNPSSLTLDRGGSATAEVQIARTDFTGAVTLSVGGAPSEVTASVSPASATGDSATLTVEAGTGAAPGSYTLTVAGQAEGVQGGTGTLALEVSAATGTSAFKAASVTAGLSHTCALKADGTAYCWGANESFQLGDGGGADQWLPVPVSGDVKFQSLAAGARHTCGIALDGAAYCWGKNNVGQLGDGTTDSRLVPTPVTGGLSFRQIDVSRDDSMSRTCGLTVDDEVYCWGDGLSYFVPARLAPSPAPLEAVGGATFARITISDMEHGCGLDEDGAAFCWGSNGFAQLGNAGGSVDRGVPTAVHGGHVFTDLVAGGRYTCGVTDQDQVLCWGNNPEGQLGDGSTTQRSVPVQVLGDPTFASVTAGIEHACGLTPDGAAYCWGRSDVGQLGTGANTTEATSPVAVAGGITFSQISAGYVHTCGVAVDNSVYCWGLNNAGQLGDGTTNDFPTNAPMPVGGTP